MSDDEITGGLDLLGDWLDAKGYGEEAGLCTRAMDLIHKQADEITRLRADLAAVTAERDRMREAVQLLITTQEEWERSVEKIIGKQPNVFLRAIDSARAALEGVTRKSGAGNE